MQLPKSKAGRVGAAALAAIVLFSGGMVAGRFSAPTKVVERDKQQKKEELKQKEETKAVSGEQKIAKKEENQHIKRSKKTTIRPDKTIEIDETEEINSGKKSDEAEAKFAATESVKTVEVKKIEIVEKEKIVTRDPPRFRVDALAGIDLRALKDDPSLELQKKLVFGLQGGVRVWGPVWLGLMVQSNKVLSVTAGIQK